MARSRAPRLPPAQLGAFAEGERIALFLGAGASLPFGYPLTSQLLPQLVQYLDDGRLVDDVWRYGSEDVALLRRGLNELLPGMAGTPHDLLPPITDVLTMIDHAFAQGTALLSGWETERVRRFRGLIEQVVADMVSPDGSDATAHLHRVADWMERTAASHSLGVVTTNYDLELELALFEKVGNSNVAKRFDFGMSWRDPNGGVVHPRPGGKAMAFYKLHGSLNWLRCPMCEYVYVNVLGSVVPLAWEPSRIDENTCDCQHWPLQSVLVTPSYVRDTREVNLVGIWRNALDLLAAADRWVIIGYSLPPEDIAIRSLLMKAHRIRRSAVKRDPLRIWAVQGRGETEKSRFQLLFPELREPGHYFDGGLEAFDLEQVLV